MSGNREWVIRAGAKKKSKKKGLCHESRRDAGSGQDAGGATRRDSTIWLAKIPETRSPNPKNPSQNPKNPNSNSGSNPRYPKLLRVVRVLGHGTRITRTTRNQPTQVYLFIFGPAAQPTSPPLHQATAPNLSEQRPRPQPPDAEPPRRPDPLAPRRHQTLRAHRRCPTPQYARAAAAPPRPPVRRAAAATP